MGRRVWSVCVGGTRSFWGWGVDDARVDGAELEALARRLGPVLGEPLTAIPVPTIDEIDVPAPRLHAPSAIDGWCRTDVFARAGHTYGKSFRDVVRGLDRDFGGAPDLVATPPDEAGVTAVLDWAADAGAIVVPYGGGSSVVGGVERPVDDDRPMISLDLGDLGGVSEIDHVSLAIRVGGGTLGPALEDALRPNGLTLRHFPQSFEFSTVGGWLATRSGGHFATLRTHIDDMVESIRVVTPAGPWESRRLPGSGAGPSPDRWVLGSEGTLGVITEAWLRVLPRPDHRASGAATFDTFDAGLRAARALGQSGLWPSNCRLVDATEAFITGAGNGSHHLLLVAFESADHPVDGAMTRAIELVADHGGRLEVKDRPTGAGVAGPVGDPGNPTDASDAWRSTFLRAPYLRDAMVRLGALTETFETAITWDRSVGFVEEVTRRVRSALDEVGAEPALVTCRVTHVYPDGAAPYFTIIAPGRLGRDRLAQWDEVKGVAMDALADLGGTVTHHHAVGRDHRPGYDRQRPDLFADSLRAVKGVLDPAGVLNPGLLIDRA